MSKVLDSKTKDRTKPLYLKITIQLKWFFRPLRNTISNASFYQRCYLLGCLIFFCQVLIILANYSPLIIGLFIIISVLSFFYKNTIFLLQIANSISNWVTYTKLIKIVFALLILVLGGYFVFKYYPIPWWISSLIRYISYFGWLQLIYMVGIASFLIGFMVEVYYIWKKNNKIINKVIYILGLISTFISSYFAKWIVIDCTKLEPTTFSRSLIIFTLAIGSVYWLFICAIILSSIYVLTSLSQILSYFYDTLSTFIPIWHQSWYRFLFRKSSNFHDVKKTKKMWLESILYRGGRGIGAGLLAYFSCGILLFIPHTYELSPNFVNQAAENIIVYADYRPNNKVSECTNLENGEWGLLVGGSKKISVAKPNQLGGYTFKTKLCIF